MMHLAKLSKRFALLVVCAGVFAQAQAQGTKVAYVATERLMTDSKLAKVAESKIESEFSKREKAIKEQLEAYKSATAAFEKSAAGMNEIDRAKRARELREMETDLQRKDRAYREDLGQRRNEERQAIADRASKIVAQIALAEGIDIVLTDVAFYSSRVDITDKILKELDK